MPITLLHFGLLAPINHFVPHRVNNFSFILANLWMDGNAILAFIFGLPGVFHGTEHSFLGAICIGAVLALAGYRSHAWMLGAFIGGISHVILDMLVHPEMHPLYPHLGNFAYMGWMEPASLVLLPMTIWLIFQYVSNSRDWLQRRREPAQEPTEEPSA